MNITKKLFLAVTLAFTSLAGAQDWPQQTVRLVVPFGPGSTPDAIARIVADKLQGQIGQAVVVENRGGAGGMIGTDIVAKAKPDGYTIGIGSVGPLVNNPLIYSKMTYDPFNDLRPITKAVSQASLLVVRSEFPANDIKGLLAELTKSPDKYSYASIGNASLSHLTMELLAQRKKLNLVHVVYPGSGQVLPAVIGGHADMTILPALVVKPMIDANRLKPMAAAMSSEMIPEIPSLKQLGLADFDIDSWFGFFAPAETPDDVIAELHQEIVAALRDPSVTKIFNDQLMEVVANTPEEFAAEMRAEQAMWKPVIESVGLKMD